MKNKKPLLILVLVLLAMVAIAGSVAAVTDGELDGDLHPHVVLIVMDVAGEPADRCSGTLVAPTVVLTAGHCTSNYPYDPFTAMRIFTESDVENGDNNYPYKGKNSIEAAAWYAHPDFETAPFYFHDVGVIILKKQVRLDEYAVLPQVDELDNYGTERGQNKIWFTSVGYGVQRINAAIVESEKVRMYANPKLDQINVPGSTGDYSLLLSNNHSTGGTCSGDSGGPNFMFDTNVVAGVTSFRLNSSCGGTGGVFRMDRQNVQDFVNQFLD